LDYFEMSATVHLPAFTHRPEDAVHVHRPVTLMVATGVLLTMHAGSAQAAGGQTIGGVAVPTSVVAWAAATPHPAVDPGATSGTGTRVSVKVLPVASGTPTPTSTPSQPVTTPPVMTIPPAPGGGGLPTTGTNGKALLALVTLGLAALAAGALLLWTSAFRRRRESLT